MGCVAVTKRRSPISTRARCAPLVKIVMASTKVERHTDVLLADRSGFPLARNYPSLDGKLPKFHQSPGLSASSLTCRLPKA